TCKAKFRQETGQEMPIEPKWDSPLWHTYIQWRYRQVEEIGKLIGEAVHKVDPKIAVIWNCSYYDTGWYAGTTPAQADWMDFAGVERLPTGHWGRYPGYTYTETLAWDMSLNRALRFGQWTQHYSYFTPITRRAEILLTANAAAAFGAQGCPQEHCRHMTGYYDRIKEVEPWMIDSISANDVALHYSVLAQNAYYQPSDHGVIDEALGDVRGVYKALLNSHLPAEVVNDEWLEQESLCGFRTVILPNSVCLTPKATAALKKYVRDGGTLVATMETGLRDSQGHRVGDAPLWKGSGLKFKGEIKTIDVKVADWFPDRMPVVEGDCSSSPDQFLMFGTKAAMKAWIGEDITLGRTCDGFERREIHQFAETPSVHVSAKAVQVRANSQWKTVLPMRYRRDKVEGFVTTPAVVTRAFGKGRIVYVNFQVGEQSGAMNSMTGTTVAHPWWRQFIKQLVKVASGAPRVAVEAPICIKTAMWKQPAKNRYMLHLVNELSTTGVQIVQHEDFVPVSAKVTIKMPGVKKVKVVVGPKGAKVSRKNKTWTVTLPGIEERAMIECS
ncbi:MAG: beta-galactosidase trimerization domain-containing protein, partial [Planctomycetes bacterium]|nr:beta-galactosidase trimerization domain-containing protein [Planctomycetota bacterium]